MFRPLVSSLVVFLLTLSSGSAATARTLADIFRLSWRGASVAPADFTQSGKVFVKQELSIRLDADNQVSGTLSSIFPLDGRDYRASATVSGRYVPSEQAIHVRLTQTRGDTLPHGLRWCSSSGRLKFYNDSDRPGHFILEGTLTLDCGGTADIQFTDQ